MTKSLFQRIAGAMWLASAISCVAAAILAVFVILNNSEQQAKNRIRTEEENLVSLGLIDLISLNEFRALVPRLPDTLQDDRLNEIIRIYEPPGKLLFTNVKTADIAKAKVNRAKLVNKGFYVIEGANKQYLALLQSHRASDGDILWIEIVTPKATPGAILKQIALPFAAVLAALLLLSFLLARWVTRRALVPLSSIAGHMDRLDVHQFKSWEPFPAADQPKEFQSIVRKVNELIVRIQNAFLNFHQLGQFVAHEVRTPLTVMQGEIESALAAGEAGAGEHEAALRSCLDEIGRIDGIVGTVLKISAKNQAARPYAPETIDLRAFIRELQPKLERYTKRGIDLSVDAETPLRIFADRELLSLLIGNLIRNIAKHTTAETRARIRVADAGMGQARVEILDGGPGLPPDVLAAANSDKPEDGALGIGLSLCKQIAGVSRIRLEFENRAGGGLEVRILCPLAT